MDCQISWFGLGVFYLLIYIDLSERVWRGELLLKPSTTPWLSLSLPFM